jgi:hypothetical protein
VFESCAGGGDGDEVVTDHDALLNRRLAGLLAQSRGTTGGTSRAADWLGTVRRDAEGMLAGGGSRSGRPERGLSRSAPASDDAIVQAVRDAWFYGHRYSTQGDDSHGGVIFSA